MPHGDINDDTKEIHWKYPAKTFHGFPVYDDDKDNVIGLIHTKRLLTKDLSALIILS